MREEQAALARFKEEFDASTRTLEARNETVPLPSFLANPPLTRDDAPFLRGQLPGAVPLVRTHFDSTVFTDASLAFDLRGLPAADAEVLPLLSAIDDLGVTTREGEVLDYAATEERVRASVYSVGLGLSLNARTRRAELVLGGTASSPEEIGRLAGWIDTYLHRARLDPSVRGRLVDVVRGRILALRGLFQTDPDSWAGQVADVIDHEDQPFYLAVHSPFTSLYYLQRWRWRLEDPAPEGRDRLRASLDQVAAAVAAGDRAALARQLAGLTGDLGEQLRFELDHLPPDTWARDLARLVREIEADLAVAPAGVFDRLRGVLAGIRVRAGARVQITSSTANADRAAPRSSRCWRRCPQGSGGRRPEPPAGPARGMDPRAAARALPGDGARSPPGPGPRQRSGATHHIVVPGPELRRVDREGVLDLLTVGLFAGGGPHSLFMRTWAAGLAYSNGIAAHLTRGRIVYSAQRCPDPVETIRFVAGFAKSARVDRDLVEASLAFTFGDYAGDESFSTRGARIAGDVLDGLEPDGVRAFKTEVLAVARAADAPERLARRIPQVLGQVLVGAGGKVAAGPARVALVAGPTRLLDRYQTFLAENGEATTLPRLYPRDFWPPEKP